MFAYDTHCLLDSDTIINLIQYLIDEINSNIMLVNPYKKVEYKYG